MKTILTVLAAAILAGPSLKADDSAACSAATLKGSYAYTVTGTRPGNMPFAAVGRISFDGRNAVSTTRTLSDGGVIVRHDSGAGTYSVAGDCTGSFSIAAAGLGGLTLDFALSNNAKEIRAIVTNAGFVLTLVGTKQ